MSWGRLIITHLACAGPDRPLAVLHYGSKGNAVIGLSERGKSYTLELTDFMLGGQTLAREIPEAAGYDTVLMGLQTSSGEHYTLRRSMSGGPIALLEGLVETRTGGTIIDTLAERESKKTPHTINRFYLDIFGLFGKLLANSKTDTQKLTIRTLSKLVLVSETKIVDQRSPVLTGQHISETPEKSLFKLLISGVDDSALVTFAEQTKIAEAKVQRASIGREFVEARLSQLAEEGLDEEGLKADLQEVELQLAELRANTSEAEQTAFTLRRRLRRLAEAKDTITRREGELNGILSRFALLNDHYSSDIERLTAIAEAAEALDSLAPGPCPLCGAPPQFQNHNDVCEADLPALAEAARAEAKRIEQLKADLQQTVERTQTEIAELTRKRAENLEQDKHTRASLVSAEEKVRAERTGYTAIAEEANVIKDKLRSFQSIRDIETSIATIEQQVKTTALPAPDIAPPRIYTDEFAQEVEKILQAWGVPGCQRVFFDPKEFDLQLNGKLRGSHGKGLRALTHSAFVIGLMTYCLKNDRPHPGFVVIDSPLLSYRGGDDEVNPEEDLKQTGVDAAFYRWLASDLPAGQVIIIENRDAPSDLEGELTLHQFGTGIGRYGFFPVKG